MPFEQAISGLNAASVGLDSIGNNLANLATHSFKSGSVSFADMCAASGKGLGVDVTSIAQNFNDGAITRTDRLTDVAISGNGFFRVQDKNGGIYYSRDGQFVRGKNGDLINNQGMVITGYSASLDAQGKVNIQNGSTPIPLNISTDMMHAKASQLAKLTTHLNSQETINANPFDINHPDNPQNSHFKTVMTTYDRQGNPLDVTVYFQKTANNEWAVYAKNAGAPNAIALGNMSFDENGSLINANNAVFDIAYPGMNGANNRTLRVDLSQTCQQRVNQSSVSAIDVDGHSAGEYMSFNIEDNGLIMANYSNRQQQVVGQIALSTFVNPQGLASQGGNLWAATNSSGNPTEGIPATGSFGKLTGGALEASNVDMSKELINMIVMQRYYQSNAQTIKTQDQILQTLVNLR